MSKKKYINLRIKTSEKTGNTFLSGFDKATETRYFVFSDKDDKKKKRLCSAKEGQDMLNIGTFEEKTGEHGDFLAFNKYLLADNRFYNEDDPYMTRKDGSYVLDSNGDKIPAPEYTLTISLD